MFKAIMFTFFIKAKNKEKALKVVNKIKNESSELEIVSIEPYWKEDNMFVVESSYSLDLNKPELAVFITLRVVNILGDDIRIEGPNIYENGLLDFSGQCCDSRIPGVELISFSIDNFER
ncbi:hypothetical protein ACIQ4I_03500 [Rummeliibacillus sp. NPDC094406]|uniref:hypothetical protein n=1 Tax=Rummeliibacillus sp. NPDC094406 TaxID=3364511 RepID=UPI00382ED3A1